MAGWDSGRLWASSIASSRGSGRIVGIELPSFSDITLPSPSQSTYFAAMKYSRGLGFLWVPRRLASARRQPVPSQPGSPWRNCPRLRAARMERVAMFLKLPTHNFIICNGESLDGEAPRKIDQAFSCRCKFDLPAGLKACVCHSLGTRVSRGGRKRGEGISRGNGRRRQWCMSRSACLHCQLQLRAALFPSTPLAGSPCGAKSGREEPGGKSSARPFRRLLALSAASSRFRSPPFCHWGFLAAEHWGLRVFWPPQRRIECGARLIMLSLFKSRAFCSR